MKALQKMIVQWVQKSYVYKPFYFWFYLAQSLQVLLYLLLNVALLQLLSSHPMGLWAGTGLAPLAGTSTLQLLLCTKPDGEKTNPKCHQNPHEGVNIYKAPRLQICFVHLPAFWSDASWDLKLLVLHVWSFRILLPKLFLAEGWGRWRSNAWKKK